MKLLEDLKWRYATKKFDHNIEVSPEEIDVIKQSIQLAATSYGLQLFKVIEVKNKSIREKLLPASWNQKQVIEASHLFVFCNYIDVEDINIDAYMKLKAEIQSLRVQMRDKESKGEDPIKELAKITVLRKKLNEI